MQRSAALILLRHGESTWNADDRFAGWVDVELTDRGRTEAVRAGELLAAQGLAPDVVHTSLLRRATVTADLTLDACGRHWIPVRRTWRLNERHYGAVQGLSRTSVYEMYGADQYRRLRRSFDMCPPPLDDAATARQRRDPRYREVPDDVLPRSESLAQVSARLLPYWSSAIAADLAAGRVTCVVAHGNSIRVLIRHLESVASSTLSDIEVATGEPIVYRGLGGEKLTLRRQSFELGP